MTQRTHPRLATISAAIADGRLELSADGYSPLVVDRARRRRRAARHDLEGRLHRHRCRRRGRRLALARARRAGSGWCASNDARAAPRQSQIAGPEAAAGHLHGRLPGADDFARIARGTEPAAAGADADGALPAQRRHRGRRGVCRGRDGVLPLRAASCCAASSIARAARSRRPTSATVRAIRPGAARARSRPTATTASCRASPSARTASWPRASARRSQSAPRLSVEAHQV